MPLTVSAVIAAGGHLFPFRTEKLSQLAPMVLGGQPPGRVGRRRLFRPRRAAFERLFVVLSRAQLCARIRVERPQPAHALPDGRVRDEDAGEAFVGEWLERVERLGRWARLELDEFRR